MLPSFYKINIFIHAILNIYGDLFIFKIWVEILLYYIMLGKLFIYFSSQILKKNKKFEYYFFFAILDCNIWLDFYVYSIRIFI